MRRLAALLLTLLLTGCSGGRPEGGTTPDPTRSATPTRSAAPAEPTWGPSGADLRRARQLVSGWSAERLAGQLMVAGYAGTSPGTPAALLRDLHLAGIKVGGFNVASRGQVAATTRAIAAAARADGRRFPPVVAVDQEGGLVEHLRGVATSYPPFATAGDAIRGRGAGGVRVVRRSYAAQAVELRALGFTWVLGPVADVTVGAGDAAIGSRSASPDPAVAARTVVAALRGYDDAGLVASVKHFPGHGAAGTDSHVALPRVTAARRTLERRELVPFRAATDAGVPSVMVGHLDVRALAPGEAATLAPGIYRHLRRDVGFDGVAVTDALEMGAVTDRPGAVVAALRAGADLVLMPDDPRAAHREIVAAIRNGGLGRARVLRSAAKVVALQLWQQRRAGAVPVPRDAAARARAAAARLSAAGS